MLEIFYERNPTFFIVDQSNTKDSWYTDLDKQNDTKYTFKTKVQRNKNERQKKVGQPEHKLYYKSFHTNLEYCWMKELSCTSETLEIAWLKKYVMSKTNCKIVLYLNKLTKKLKSFFFQTVRKI